MKCCQCDRLAMFTIGPEAVPVCLHCNSMYQQTQNERLNILHKAMEFADQHMNEVLGFDPKPEPKVIALKGSTILNNINFNNSSIGLLNTGRIQAESIDLSINSLKNNNQNDIADILKQITESLLNNPAMSVSERSASIELVSLISEEAVKPPEYRKKSLIFDSIDKLGKVIQLAVNGKKLWDFCYPYLNTYFA